MLNYRPSFSKIFERVIYTRLEFHIHSNNIIAQEQHSFRTNSSTQLPTHNLTDDTLTALDNNLLVEDNSVILQKHMTVWNMIYYLQNWSIMVCVLWLMSSMSCGIIFWCNSPYSNSIFKIQERIIRIIMNTGKRVSCHPLFKNLNILPIYSQYTSSVSTHVIKNTDAFKSNSAKHNISTRPGFDLHPPTTNLTKAQKAVYSKLKFSIYHHILSNYLKKQTNLNCVYSFGYFPGVKFW
jgi:hypothetical protein